MDFVFVHASEGFPVAAEEVPTIVGLDDLARLVGDLIRLTLQIGGVGDQGRSRRLQGSAPLWPHTEVAVRSVM